jgi:hypothetical protein
MLRTMMDWCILLLYMPTVPVLRYLEVGRPVGLKDPTWTNCLCTSRDGMMLHVAWLDMLRVTCNEWHILTLLILDANFPTSEKLRSRLNMLKPWVLKRSLELAAHNVLQAIVGDDMVVSTLILHRDGLLHQPLIFELITVNEGATEAPLLVWREGLREVGVDLACRVALARECAIKGWVLVLVIRVVYMVAGLGN